MEVAIRIPIHVLFLFVTFLRNRIACYFGMPGIIRIADLWDRLIGNRFVLTAVGFFCHNPFLAAGRRLWIVCPDVLIVFVNGIAWIWFLVVIPDVI